MSDDRPLVTEVREDGVAILTFDRPAERNALDAPQWERLARALEDLAANPAVRCLIVTGRGQSFAAGGDLKTMLDELQTEADAKAFRDRLARCFSALCHFPRPTIASINGPAIGGGLEIAMSCDVRVASTSVRFGMPAARFGIVMAQAEFARLVGIVGLDRARFMAITGEIIAAEQALSFGLVHEVHPPEALAEAAEKWAKRLLAMDPEAVSWFRNTAAAMEAATEQSVDPAFEFGCLLRPEFRRRVESFLRK